jgi:uncharacterized SAM-binding protein YcdF (DUF218 family)
VTASTVVRRASIALALLIVLTLLTATLWIRSIGTYLVRAQEPAHADVILVLGGDWTGQRILTAAELARRGYAPRLWVSGPMVLYGVNEATLAINYAVEHGYPRSLFEIKTVPATSTRQEAMKFKEEFAKNNIRRILLVTSDFHTRRAGSIFRNALGDQYQVIVIAAPYMYFHAGDWWKFREDRKTVFYEWSKMVGETFGL